MRCINRRIALSFRLKLDAEEGCQVIARRPRRLDVRDGRQRCLRQRLRFGKVNVVDQRSARVAAASTAAATYDEDVVDASGSC
jgi:hypothetical protein